jgi:hypothetical protein
MARRLAIVRGQFATSVTSALEFAQRGQNARHHAVAQPAFRRQELEWIYEAALMKVFVAWETYMESVMGCYAIGQRAPSGYRAPRLRQRRVQMSLSEILRVFRGDQRFVGWSEPGIVIRRARDWFKNGEPFATRVGAAAQTVSYLRILRNAIAHESESAQDTFVSETRRLYGAAVARPTPGGQLLGPCPAAIPGLTGASLLQGAAQVLSATASALAP